MTNIEEAICQFRRVYRLRMQLAIAENKLTVLRADLPPEDVPEFTDEAEKIRQVYQEMQLCTLRMELATRSSICHETVRRQSPSSQGSALC